jgi:hypothetical protein
VCGRPPTSPAAPAPADDDRCCPLPSFYEGGVYLVEGVFTRRARGEARLESMTPAQAARWKKQVGGSWGCVGGGCIVCM